jgi:hypothetical protein
MEGSGCSLIWVLSWYFSRGNEENQDHFSQDSQPRDRDLNPGPPEYEARVLTNRLRS